MSSAEEATERFRARATSVDPNHSAAASLQESPGAAPIAELYADMLAMLTDFPETVYVESVSDEVAVTLNAVRKALASAS